MADFKLPKGNLDKEKFQNIVARIEALEKRIEQLESAKKAGRPPKQDDKE